MPRWSYIDQSVLIGFLLVQLMVLWYFHRRIFQNIQGNTSNSNNENGLPWLSPFPSHPSTTAKHVRVLLDPELEAAQAYVQSFVQLGKRNDQLQFLHIPKTAGTAVEQVAAEHGVAWGSCRFPHKPKRKICPSTVGGYDWPRRVGWWHVPSQWFPLQSHSANLKNDEANSDMIHHHPNQESCSLVHPYHNAEMFAIVRSPLVRVVSEYYYACTLQSKEWRPNHCPRSQLHNATHMNAWIRDKLHRNQQHQQTGGPGTAVLPYLLDNGHWVPQSEYILGPHNVRMVDYVLVLDSNNHQDNTLSQQFDRLMQAFGIPIALRHVQSIGRSSNSTLAASSTTTTTTTNLHNKTQLTVDDLTSDTIRRLQQVYATDTALVSSLQQP